jgi:hypothetical protein
VASYRRTVDFWVSSCAVPGSLSPLVQRFGISPHLDGIDAFRIHRVGGYGDVNATIELAGTRDESTESGDGAVPILGIHEFVAGASPAQPTPSAPSQAPMRSPLCLSGHRTCDDVPGSQSHAPASRVALMAR